jgi:hypothetical protein
LQAASIASRSLEQLNSRMCDICSWVALRTFILFTSYPEHTREVVLEQFSVYQEELEVVCAYQPACSMRCVSACKRTA